MGVLLAVVLVVLVVTVVVVVVLLLVVLVAALLFFFLQEIEKNDLFVTGSVRECQRAAMVEYTPEMSLTIDLPLSEAPWTFKWNLLKPTSLVRRCCAVSPALRRMFDTSVSMMEMYSNSALAFVFLFGGPFGLGFHARRAHGRP